MYEKIKKWYILGLWSETMVQNAVGKLLNQQQADEICREG